ncbi:Gfo/Idh/MocA family oxidoreductase [bacterium]|nr:Gfo/Idh/MocA family oxidoreductase [bacterium]
MVAAAPIVKKDFIKASPSNTINIAVAGIRSRGRSHYRRLAKIPNVNIVALCDVDENLFPERVAELEKLTGKKPKTYVDYRKLLEDKDIDAVALATPDHWHALHMIWACQAGKDVYMEKPISHNISEGRKMVQAARKYNRVVQAGTQSRSSYVVQEAIRLLKDGIIGDIYLGRGIVFGHRPNIGLLKDSPIPKGVHWDTFLGPAPYRPFNKNRFHYNWHWYWDTATSEFGNNGTHSIDRVRWGMGKRVHPVKIQCMGGFYSYKSDQEIPNVQVGSFQYEDGTIVELEVRSLYSNAEDNKKTGSFLYGTKGWMYIDHFEFRTYFGKGRKEEPGPSMSAKSEAPKDKKVVQGFGSLDVEHLSNFIECVRSRRWQDLNADIQEGHMSTTMMHLGNIAFRTGRTLTFNPYAEKFVNDEDADSYLTKKYRHPYVMPDEV